MNPQRKCVRVNTVTQTYMYLESSYTHTNYFFELKFNKNISKTSNFVPKHPFQNTAISMKLETKEINNDSCCWGR